VDSEAIAGGREALGRHFRAAIPNLLTDWRSAIAADPLLTANRSLPRAQLFDHLPGWLESLAVVLAAPADARAVEQADTHEAEAHGVQRWQQGYDLHEVTREWGCLHRCLVAEVERFVAAHPELPRELASEAHTKLADRVAEALSRSAQQYFDLERIAAAGSLRDLEHALADVRELERRRAELWQQAAHDLRGNLGVVSNVAQGLEFQNLPAERRQDFLALLRNNVTALRHLLDDVTELARLQAGQEERRIATFDAAELLQRLAGDLRSFAESRGLFVATSGPDALEVEGDAVKVRRIAQNLLLNALKYTSSGGVTIRWEGLAAAGGNRWQFYVEDTGPGFHAGPGAPIVEALDPAAPGRASDAAASAGSAAAASAGSADAAPAAEDGDDRPIAQAQGEGIGLAIVKRLCDLLDAAIEIESSAAQGTRVRVQLPSRYSARP
jgi:signal transduction histidine kinase